MATALRKAITDMDNLQVAWREVRRGGRTPGLDGVRLHQFEHRLDTELGLLREELTRGTYRPWPALRLQLPKEDGGIRLVGVQSVRDRVAQQALLRYLGPRIESQLEDSAFAYRPGRSIEQALSRLEGWRSAGYNWVVRTDIAACFDSIELPRLESVLQTVLPETDVRRWINLWLRAGSADSAHAYIADDTGIPQGDVLSPLLCNLFLDPFDEAISARHQMIRYADDIVLVAKSEREARKGLERIHEQLVCHGLERNHQKEWIGTFDQGFTYLGAAICGSLRLPLRPVRPGKWGYGYSESRYERQQQRQQQRSSALSDLSSLDLSSLDLSSLDLSDLATTKDDLSDRFAALLKTERNGGGMTSMEEAFLNAWRQQPAFERHRQGWQSVYLI